MKNKTLVFAIFFLLILLTVIGGTAVWGSGAFPYISLITSVFACVPFFLSFEGEKNTRRVVLLAVTVAISVAGRFVFAPIQFFKPVSAIVILAGMYFGSEFGFLTGALSAVVSDFYFGQGPWTPFQMISWGVIGLLAGILSRYLIKNKIILLVFGALSGALFSLIMDIWTTLSIENGVFNIMRFFAAVTTSLPVMAVYSVSNVIFLMILSPIFGKKIERLKTKYGI